MKPTKIASKIATWASAIDRIICNGKGNANSYYSTFAFYFAVMVGLSVKEGPVDSLSALWHEAYPIGVGEIALTLILFLVSTALTFPTFLSVVARMCAMAVLLTAGMVIGLASTPVAVAILAIALAAYACELGRLYKAKKKELRGQAKK